MSLTTTLLRRFSGLLGFPPRTGELIQGDARRKLAYSVVGSFGLSVLDMVGVAAMLPMMQYVSGLKPDTGALGLLRRALGNPTDSKLVLVLSVLILTAFVLKDVCAYVFRRWQVRFMAGEEVATSTKLLEGYLVGPYSWHLAQNTSDKIWTIETAVAIGYSQGISSALGLITEVFSVSLIFLSLLLVSPIATLAAVTYFSLAGIFVLKFIRPRMTEASRRSVQATQATTRTSLQSLGAAKEIKLRNAHSQFVDSYHEARTLGSAARAQNQMLQDLPKYILDVVFVMGIGLLAVVATATNNSQSLLVLLGVFVAAGSRVLPSAVRLLNALSGIRFSREPLAHLVTEFSRQNTARKFELAAVVTERIPQGDIAIRDLTFAYSDQPSDLVLQGINLDIPEGTSVALVGSSGAGKSTLVDILLGLHLPNSGSVTAGGISVFDNLPGWQANLAVVPQDVHLLDNTLRANICFDEDVNEERLAEVVARSQLNDLVAGLPLGLDNEVGERGARLSGGQRQRIGIARALYRSPEILILDEATSALDNDTERRFTETIAALGGSMTMIIVAHRLSTVRHCDQLIMMSRGKVAAAGTFDEVAASNAEFAHMVSLGTLGPLYAHDPDIRRG